MAGNPPAPAPPEPEDVVEEEWLDLSHSSALFGKQMDSCIGTKEGMKKLEQSSAIAMKMCTEQVEYDAWKLGEAIKKGDQTEEEKAEMGLGIEDLARDIEEKKEQYDKSVREQHAAIDEERERVLEEAELALDAIWAVIPILKGDK